MSDDSADGLINALATSEAAMAVHSTTLRMLVACGAIKQGLAQDLLGAVLQAAKTPQDEPADSFQSLYLQRFRQRIELLIDSLE